MAAAPAIAEEFTYIIPVSGSVFAGSDLFFGHVRVINSSSRTSNVSVADIIRGSATKPCSPTPPVTLQSGEMTRVGSYYKDPCLGIYSLVIRSDQTIDVRSEIKYYKLGPPSMYQEQRIDVATRWIEPGQTGLIADVEIFWFEEVRANLFITNPNDFAIDVDVTVERPECCPSRAETMNVPAHTLAQFRIVPIESPPNHFPVVYEFLHHLRLSANAKFQAGASSLGGSLAPQYRPAVILSR